MTGPDTEHDPAAQTQEQDGRMLDDEKWTAASWPIATCLHSVPAVRRDGTTMHDAPVEVWDAVFERIARVGFDLVEMADSHVRPADTDPVRRDELIAAAADHGIRIPSVHVQRKSVIQPGHEDENLAYAHRTIDAAAEWGMEVFSTGLHQPLADAQRAALWFWTAQGPVDPDDPETWDRAVRSLRELGRHAAGVGLPMALELYEDTYLGTAAGAVRLVEEIGLDTVGLNPDVANLVRLHRPVEDWRDLFEATLPHAVYMHVKNYARDEAWDGSWATSTPSTMEAGLIDYRFVFERAVELGFHGIILTEQYGGDSLGVCATNQKYIRTLLPSAAGAGEGR